MCGINGFNFKNDNLILAMNKTLCHRGPDGDGIFSDEDVALGHTRLAVIDLSSQANQPMFSDDGGLVIVFNGEIYNFLDLKKELAEFYNFKTKSDTEVILAAYKKWGTECVNKLNGIFAFAIWDKNKKELFLARDRVGVKPLYYYWDEKSLIFSSEIKAILEHPVKREISDEAVARYFHIHYVPGPMTIFKNIFKLPPASFLMFKGGKIDIQKYWSPYQTEKMNNREEIKGEIIRLLDSSVQMQLVSDRPLGVFLSGGIDSSAIAYFASKYLPKVKTFSVGFEVDENDQKFNVDFELAKKTANFFGAEHHEFVVSANDVLKNVEQVAYFMDEPISNPTQSITYLLSKFASSEVAVVLGGDGGDEIFGGYDRYRLSRIISLYQTAPLLLRKMVGPCLGFWNEKWLEKMNAKPDASRYLGFMSEKEFELRRVLKPEFLDSLPMETFFMDNYFNVTDNDFENTFMLADLQTWLVDESLMRTDKMSMSFGLEERVPFLDHRLVELGFKIPSKFKLGVRNLSTKVILKDALKPFLPDYLFTQPKRGWFSPMAKWLRGDLNGFAHEVLSENYCPGTSRFFDFSAARKILDDHINKKKYNLQLIWSLIVFQLWYKRYMC